MRLAVLSLPGGVSTADEPRWNLPEDPPDQEGWSGLEIKTLRFPGHPQETTENSVDVGHLRYVHGYDSVGRDSQISVDGPYLLSRFNFRRTQKIAKIAPLTFDVSATAHIHGLGYSFVEISERSIGMDMRLWVLATPVDGTLIDMNLVSQVREIRSPKRWIAGTGVPAGWSARAGHEQVHFNDAKGRCPAGRDHLAQQAVRVPPAPVSFRR